MNHCFLREFAHGKVIFNKNKMIGENMLNKNIKLIAHRGCLDPAPPNTLAAFEAAIEFKDAVYPVVGSELDIQLSGDGQIVVYHDGTINADNEDASLHLRDISYEAILDIVSKKSSLKDYGVPLFTDVLKLVNHHATLYVEIKDYQYDHDLFVKELKRILEEYKPDDDIVLHSFSAEMLEKVIPATENMGIKYGFLFGVITELEAVSDRLISQLDYLHPEHSCLLSDINKIALYQLPVNTWTVNSNTDLINILSLEDKDIIKGVITDDLRITEEGDK